MKDYTPEELSSLSIEELKDRIREAEVNINKIQSRLSEIDVKLGNGSASASRAVTGIDAFNRVTEDSPLSYQNLASLLRITLKKNGQFGRQIYQVLNNEMRIVVISKDQSLDHSLRDEILRFIGRDDQEKLSIALCKGAINAGEIEGNTHWTALHLRKSENQDGCVSVQAFHANSIGDGVPVAVVRVLDSISQTQLADLSPDLQANQTYQNACAKIGAGIINFNGVQIVNCPKQQDIYSCGYRTAFNMLAMHLNEDLDLIAQGREFVNVNEFIEGRKADLKEMFNGANQERQDFSRVSRPAAMAPESAVHQGSAAAFGRGAEEFQRR